jgi:hypothetical protein
MRIQILALISVTFPALQAAVIYNAEPQTIVGLTANNTVAFDFDRNGVEDLRVEAVYLGLSTPVVQFLSPTTLLATVWESEPNTAIVAGAVPEPSTTLLLSLAGGSLLFWRKRAN